MIILPLAHQMLVFPQLQGSTMTTFASNLAALFLVEEILLAKCNTVELPYLVVPRGSQADLNKAESVLAGLKRIWIWSLQLFCMCSMQSPAEPDNRATGFRGSLQGFCSSDLNKTISYQFYMTMCWFSCDIRPTGSSRQCTVFGSADVLGLKSRVRNRLCGGHCSIVSTDHTCRRGFILSYRRVILLFWPSERYS